MQRSDFTLKINDGAGVTGGELPVSRFQADSGMPTVAVAMVPAVFGLDEVTLKHIESFVDRGAVVYALDSFWRSCPGPLGQEGSEREQALQRMVDLNDADCDTDVAAMISAIGSEFPKLKIVGLGVCFGGRPIVRAALDGSLAGVASWHGIRIGELADELLKLEIPAALEFGEIDPVVPMAEVERISDALPERSDIEVRVYEGCNHGFTHFGREQFDQQAYQMSFNAFVALF